MDWSATPDDPHGYKKLRAAVDSFALQLDDLGLAPLATRLRTAQQFVGMPTEWMGETALALNSTLSRCAVARWLAGRHGGHRRGNPDRLSPRGERTQLLVQTAPGLIEERDEQAGVRRA